MGMNRNAPRRTVERPAGYYVDHNSHGFSLILEHGDGEADSLGLFPSRIEASDARDALRSLRSSR